MMPLVPHHQRGSALLIALFLIVVVAALGIFAIRLEMDQRQTATLELLQARANLAAHAGLEYWTGRAFPPPSLVPCANRQINFLAADRLDGFVVNASCTRIVMGAQVVYRISSTATHGVYGQRDFVRRTLTRTVTNMDTSGANAGWQSIY